MGFFDPMLNELILEPLDISHIDHVMTWVNDPEVVKNFQHFGKKFTREEEIKFIEKLIASPNDEIFSIFTKDGEYIGQGGFNQISWENKLGRLSLFIVPKHWGKGYAQVVIPLFLKVAFGELNLHKVWLVAWATNKKVLHIYEKCGFKKEGILKDEYFWRGEYHDMVRMAVLAGEWYNSGCLS